MSIFSDRLSELFETRKVTRKSLAEYLGVTYKTVNNYENGSREPGIEQLNRIADFFDVTVDYLTGRSDDPHGFSVSSSGEHVAVAPGERKLIETIRDLPPGKQQQVTQFADFLKSQDGKRDEESATREPGDIEADITEIAAHMESEYGIDDPEFVEHIHNVIRRAQRKYDEMIARQKNNG